MNYAGLSYWPEPPVNGNDAATMLGSLERQRATFAWKTGGLDAAGLAQRLGDSAITLGGLVKHLAHVEDYYFTVRLWGRAPTAPFNVDDWEWPWVSGATDDPAHLYALWQAAVDRSRLATTTFLEAKGLDAPVAIPWPDGRAPSLRRTLADLIEEYARHVGHADLVRESIDGLQGEDPPDAHDE